MSIFVSYTNPDLPQIEIPEGDIIELSTVALFGTGNTEYASLLNTNILHVLENSATPNPTVDIATPVIGQTVYNTQKSVMEVYNLSTGGFETVGIPWVDDNAPTTDSYRLWINGFDNYTHVNLNGTWSSVAQRYLDLSGGDVTGNVTVDQQVISNGPFTSTDYQLYNMGDVSQGVQIMTDEIVQDGNTIDLATGNIIFNTPILFSAIGDININNVVTINDITFTTSTGINAEQNEITNLSNDLSDTSSAFTVDYYNQRSAFLLNDRFLQVDGTNQMDMLLSGDTFRVEIPTNDQPLVTLTRSYDWELFTSGVDSASDSFNILNRRGGVYNSPLLFVNSDSVSLSQLPSLDRRWTNVQNPIDLQDIATKWYVDDRRADLEALISQGGLVRAIGRVKANTLTEGYNIAGATRGGTPFSVYFEESLGTDQYTVLFSPITDEGSEKYGGNRRYVNYYTASVYSKEQAFFQFYVIRNVVDHAKGYNRFDDQTFELRSAYTEVPETADIWIQFMVIARDS